MVQVQEEEDKEEEEEEEEEPRFFVRSMSLRALWRLVRLREGLCRTRHVSSLSLWRSLALSLARSLALALALSLTPNLSPSPPLPPRRPHPSVSLPRSITRSLTRVTCGCNNRGTGIVRSSMSGHEKYRRGRSRLQWCSLGRAA